MPVVVFLLTIVSLSIDVEASMRKGIAVSLSTHSARLALQSACDAFGYVPCERKFFALIENIACIKGLKRFVTILIFTLSSPVFNTCKIEASNKIVLLWCHSHIELRLIEVEVKVSGMSLTSFRGQIGTFLMVDIIDFVRFVCFLFF